MWVDKLLKMTPLYLEKSFLRIFNIFYFQFNPDFKLTHPSQIIRRCKSIDKIVIGLNYASRFMNNAIF